jgi:signal transduction histidine kinase
MQISSKLVLPLTRLLFALAIAVIVCQFRFDYIESALYDLRVRMRPTPATSGHIQVVTIDPHTIDSLHRTPNAQDHLALLKKLQAAGVRVVIYMFEPTEIPGAFDDLKAFAAEAASLPHFYVALSDVAPKSQLDAFKLPPPFESLTALAAPSTADRNIFAKDDVSRRMLTSYQGQLTLHPIVAALYNPDVANEAKIRGRFDYLESGQVYINFRPAGAYPNVSFLDITSGRADLQKFKDAVVIIGRDIQATAKDYVRTPYSRDVIAMNLPELHANMLDTLILNAAPRLAPRWLDWFFTCLISILAVYLVLMAKPAQGLLLLAASVLTFFIICYLAFWWVGCWIGTAHPVLAIFVCYYFLIPYRLIMENRRSWEYLQKNRLLTQVEELKTNFLSMMSHDLKTPIARIQGMTEVVLKDPTPLSERQTQALQTLAKSSEELLEFVSSILNLGRIESKELELHMHSKDPNTLIEDVLAKYDYLAASKRITIHTELEPLFSITMDVDLIRQVLSNLVENAIKYSPEGTRIMISTEERANKVVIQVADQGNGIPSDELPFVFEKFYRSKNAKSSATKGSGLGLYLAKYFVELHAGSISVDSDPGQGSTFTVELPMQRP